MTHKYRFKKIYAVLFCFFFVSAVFAQKDTGVRDSVNFIAESNNELSRLHFNPINYLGTSFQGSIRSNLLGSKYTYDFKYSDYKLLGQVKDKGGNFHLNLRYKDQAITGEIKHYFTEVSEDWNITFLGENLKGNVKANIGTKSMYHLDSENYKVDGYIKFGISKLIYGLNINGKQVSGTMKYHMNANKHSYELMLDGLDEDEFGLFLLIESIRSINERIDDIDKFQEKGKQ